MRAIVKFAKGPEGIDCRQQPEVHAEKGWIKLKTVAAGICGTDLHIANDEYPYNPSTTLGHEHVGVVVEVGEGVTGFAVGDTVVSLARVLSCGECECCKKGLYMLCKQGKSIGVGINGAMAEYVVVPAERAFVIPGEPKIAYALIEPLACCYRAVMEIADIKENALVYISGPGLMGQLVLQLAKRRGATVIISGIAGDEERMEQAKKVGADYVCLSGEEVQNALKELGAVGAEYSFECAGAAPSFQNCLDYTKPTGTVTQVGLYARPITIDMNAVLYKELRILTSYGSNHTTWAGTLKMQAEKPFILEPYISGIYALEECKKGFDAARAKQGYKILFQP